MAADHNDNIIITLTLAAAPLQEQGFSRLAWLADGVTFAERFRIYTSSTAVATDVTAGLLPSVANLVAARIFAQRPTPRDFIIAKQASGETIGVALAAFAAATDDWYGLSLRTRTAADIVIVATALEGSEKLFFLQSSDSSWLDAGIPTALAAIAGFERTAAVYHTDDTERADAAWPAGTLAFNPDIRSAPWDRPVKAITALSPLPSDTQKAFLDSNFANHALPYGGELTFMDAGVNLAGRPLYEIVTADWFRQRLRERVAVSKVEHSARGSKFIVGPIGQNEVLGIINGLLLQGVTAGHFVDGQNDATALEITSADLAAQRMRFQVRATDAVSGRIFEFDINVSRDPIFTE